MTFHALAPAGAARRRRARGLVALTATFALALVAAACGAGASPAIPIPTEPVAPLPTAVPTDQSTGASACLDSATMDLLSQMQAPDADVEGTLAANKATLLSGLKAFEAPDEVTAAWRDDLVAALEADDYASAAAQVQALTTSGITLSAC